MTRRAPPQLAEFLEPFSADLHRIVRALRTRVLAVMPNAHEFVWDATNAVSLVYTPTTRWQDGIAHIATYPKRVNLGFNDGASLADPLRVLTGTGSRIRHVSFRSAVDVDEATWIDDYIAAALTQAGVSPEAGDRGTTIRVSDGPKRRPG
jgi:hypothetical protein